MSGESLSDVRCVACGKGAELRYERGGWWGLPEGWLYCASASRTRYVCSRDCAEEHEEDSGRRDED